MDASLQRINPLRLIVYRLGAFINQGNGRGHGMAGVAPQEQLDLIDGQGYHPLISWFDSVCTLSPCSGGRMRMSVAMRRWSRLVPVMCMGIWLLGSLMMPPALVHGEGDGDCGDPGSFTVFPIFDI